MEQKPIKILHQPLKAKWYRMIKDGKKTEEYREPGLYWCQRIQPCPCPASCVKDTLTPSQHLGRQYCCQHDMPCPVNFDLYARRYTHVQFSLGYPKKDDESRRMTFELKGIEYREGREEWGAEKGKKYLVEVLGRRTTLDGTKLWEE